MNKCIGKMVSALLLLTVVLGFVSCNKTMSRVLRTTS